jgi:hypothetical protein
MAFEHRDRWKYTGKEYDQWLKGHNPHGSRFHAAPAGEARDEVMKLIESVIDFVQHRLLHPGPKPGRAQQPKRGCGKANKVHFCQTELWRS